MHGLFPPDTYPVRKYLFLAADVVETFSAVVLQPVAAHEDANVQGAAQVLHVRLIAPMVIARHHKLRLQ